MKEVVYEVDGTAKYVNLTLTNPQGGKEQNQVKLPFELKFYAKGGQFVYLSAQKVTRGNVHVLIRCSGAVLQEASADAPYGIATAEGKLPE